MREQSNFLRPFIHQARCPRVQDKEKRKLNRIQSKNLLFTCKWIPRHLTAILCPSICPQTNRFYHSTICEMGYWQIRSGSLGDQHLKTLYVTNSERNLNKFLQATRKQSRHKGGLKQLHRFFLKQRYLIVFFELYFLWCRSSIDTPFRSHDVLYACQEGGRGGNRAEIHPVQIHKFKG